MISNFPNICEWSSINGLNKFSNALKNYVYKNIMYFKESIQYSLLLESHKYHHNVGQASWNHQPRDETHHICINNSLHCSLPEIVKKRVELIWSKTIYAVVQFKIVSR